MKRKAFISYASVDNEWAKWVTNVLEQNGFSVFIGERDLHPGDDFATKINETIRNADVVILILSDAYVKSVYCSVELGTAFMERTSRKMKIIPIRVSDVTPSGLLAGILYLDLCGSVTEAEAKQRLLSSLCENKPKIISSTYPISANNISVEFPGNFPLNNLPARNPYFTGRVNALSEIYEALKKGNISVLEQSITGMGGLGKTQTALEYAYKYARKYNWIWWIFAETEATVENAYKKFAMTMNLSNYDHTYGRSDVEVVLNWMEAHSNWLFIFDNVDLSDSNNWIENYLPKRTLGHVLFTTRNQNSDKGLTVNVDTFTKDEAVEFLIKRTGIRNDIENASKIADHLSFLPLALEQAAAYIVETPSVTFKDYINIVEKYEHESLLRDYRHSIATTLEISINKINQESAKQLLNLCAYMASHKIPFALFNRNKDLIPEPLRSDLSDDNNANLMFRGLAKYSLIVMDKQEFSLNPLLQGFLRDSHSDNTEWVDICLKIFLSDVPCEYDNWESKERFFVSAEHAYLVSEYVYSFCEDNDSKLINVSELYFRLGCGFNEIGQYERALTCYHKALSIREKVLGKNHVDTARVYNNISTVCKHLGNYNEALKWLHIALKVSLEIYGENHALTGKTYNNIGSVYTSQADYSKALEWYQRAVNINENILGKEHPDTATNYSNIAGVYFNQGDYDKALEWFYKVLAIDEKVLTIDHPSKAKTYNNIALIYSKRNENEKALELYYKALIIREKVLGTKHPETATTYNNIAFVYSNLGDYQKAMEWLHKSLEICENVFGNEHPDTAIAYNNIAFMYFLKGEYKKAIEWFKKALTITELVFGKTHQSTVKILENIAEVENMQNDKDNNSTSGNKKIQPLISDIAVDFSMSLPNVEVSEFCEWYVSLDSKVKLGSDSDFRAFLTELQTLIKKIKVNSEFHIDDENAPELCQYTKLSTPKFLVKSESEEGQIPKFRLSNVAYLNDPSEGQVFIDLLNCCVSTPIFEELFGASVDKIEHPLTEVHLNDVYIGSFTTAKNKLPMWTLYGDNSKGCCMVFDKSFFTSSKSSVDSSGNYEYEQDIKLYKVHYFNTKELCKSGNDDDVMRSLRAIATNIEQWHKIVMMNSRLLSWITNRLDEIRFLFKCDDYLYEDEVRLILRDDKVNKPFVDRSTEIPKIYINVNNPVILKEVILGAKVENPSAPAQFLLFSGVKKVTLSGITYR